MNINFLCYWLKGKAIVNTFNENQLSLLLAEKKRLVSVLVNENQLSLFLAQT